MSVDRREMNEREEMQQDMPKLSQAQGARDRGREGRILGKMSEMKGGQARRRLRKGMRSMEMGYPDKPSSISAFSDINEVMQPVTDPLPPVIIPPPVDFDDPNLPLTDEEDRRR